ncbi:ABC transporter ATP-binding protein [Pseudokineococcus lusitanus]|uniref:ABC-2 type transport system ATP-binding protein n=1 Tax=Pseudokineococcus lusitanus TaxID=763993 RepID=A0A3N1HJY6_9ACTN|nr:ABC transporter ATP-binding protein [Pseudokineococcus lusitanus]ROP42804.1 ABC-2 type transport system ATP-binding protein [Pseudokineococcus lusitanus]
MTAETAGPRDAGDALLARVVGVTRRYAEVTALDDVSLDVPAGQLLGLLGPNGAGKSTLLQLLCGLRRPTSGRVELFGLPPTEPAARRSLGMTPQETGLPPTLRVGEVVDVVAGHFAAPMPTGDLLERFGIADLRRRQTGGLSGGQKRRLAVALAFVGRPRLVLLDEPTTGLDVDARHDLWAAVREYHREGGTVVLTSHYLEEVEALAERVVVVDRGRVLVDGTLDEVRSAVPSRRVRLRAAAPPALAGADVTRVVSDGDRHELWTTDADDLVRRLVRSGTDFRDLEVASASLEEAFLAVTAGAAGPASPTAAPRPGTEKEVAR